MKKGSRFIVLKYGTGVKNCIELHKDVLDQYGYCWFGKIGVAPSEKSIIQKLNTDEWYAVLYRQGVVHLCRFDKISFEKPDDGYPKYYESYFYNRNIVPSIYFRFLSIEKIESNDLAECVSLGSGNRLLDTVSRSMASFFYGVLPDSLYVSPEETKKKNARRKVKAEKKSSSSKNKRIVENSCKYSMDGVCSCKTSVNYGYECERPASCIRQKPILVEE